MRLGERRILNTQSAEKTARNRFCLLIRKDMIHLKNINCWFRLPSIAYFFMCYQFLAHRPTQRLFTMPDYWRKIGQPPVPKEWRQGSVKNLFSNFLNDIDKKEAP